MAKKVTYSDHPCVTVDKLGIPHLNIFQNFFVETRLPKFKIEKDPKKDKEDDPTSDWKVAQDTGNIVLTSNDVVVDSNETGDSSDSIIYTPANLMLNVGTISTSPYGYERSMSNGIRRMQLEDEKTGKIKGFFRRIFHKKTPAEKAFKEIKNSMRIPNTEDMAKSLKAVGELYKLLEKSGQYEKANQILTYTRTLTFEINLINHGITKYLLEKDVIDFMLKSDRGIGITFLRYYDNLLPADVMKKKVDVDKLMVFDNYVVLYYDPNQAIFRRHVEKEAEMIARDPILFGMIEGSNKLYYICDWVYKDDDITLEKVEKVLGRTANNIVDATVENTSFTITDVLKSIETAKDVFNGQPAEKK